MLHGVELSKDDTGVTLKTPLTNTVVHFDGDTAHVTGTGNESSVEKSSLTALFSSG